MDRDYRLDSSLEQEQAAPAVAGIEPTFPSVLPLREDVVKEKKDPTRKELLSRSPQRVVADQIAIPNIMG